MEEILRMENLTKIFPGVVALDGVQLSVYGGEIHAVMGENGAGKSTLMKIINGLYHADSGEMYLKGKKVAFKSPQDALRSGIALVHQELMSVLDMTVADNIFLGKEPRKKNGLIDYKKLYADTKTFLDEVELDVKPKQQMRGLSTAKRQLIDTAKALSYKPDLLIMDEPTSSLTTNEIQTLFRIMRNLKDRGVTILFITHKLDEVFDIADRISVYRDGQYIGTSLVKDVTETEVVKMMVGRDIEVRPRDSGKQLGEVTFEVRNLNVPGLLKDINFSVRKGEILGFSGQVGAGRTETMEAVFGLRKAESGEVYINGELKNIKNPNVAIKNGLAFLTEDRKLTGLNLIASVSDNITAVALEKFSPRFWIQSRKEVAASEEMVKKMRIKTPSIRQIVKNLSGGNQQKVVIAKWLLKDVDILIMDEPTRGIDVGAKDEIYVLINELAREGKTIVLISSEMQEIMNLSDRIIVFNSGIIAGEITGEEINQENIFKLSAKSIAEDKVNAQ